MIRTVDDVINVLARYFGATAAVNSVQSTVITAVAETVDFAVPVKCHIMETPVKSRVLIIVATKAVFKRMEIVNIAQGPTTAIGVL